ncbi:hypothetical protein TYRP_014065 [Tyrophagus putrescentiae]|nr:hypothetical protein TYRP_014065 [Tyrophagus putrescentiae]
MRLTLASLDLPRTSAASGLARSAREILVGGRSCGSPWLHLGDRQRPPPQTLLAPLARPSATGVGSRPSQRLTLTSLGQCATPAASDLARCARKARGGERCTLPK